MIAGFVPAEIDVRDAKIFCCRKGSGEPVLLLHGFPETSLMWRQVAPRLATDFTVVCADLRGYGRSSCPASLPDHSPYSKRVMAADMIKLMDTLGFESFSVIGHDRGARAAYRLALDHPGRVRHIAVLDIVPTESVWAAANAEFALCYWPWSLLAQPAPLPEKIMHVAADAIVDSALGQWGSARESFSDEVREAYVAVLRDQDHAHAICEEYRAAATIDREHDRIDRQSGKLIACPFLVLWGESGPLDTWYENKGGPIELWRAYAAHPEGRAVPGGHFFPEEQPELTAKLLRNFLAGSS